MRKPNPNANNHIGLFPFQLHIRRARVPNFAGTRCERVQMVEACCPIRQHLALIKARAGVLVEGHPVLALLLERLVSDIDDACGDGLQLVPTIMDARAEVDCAVLFSAAGIVEIRKVGECVAVDHMMLVGHGQQALRLSSSRATSKLSSTV